MKGFTLGAVPSFALLLLSLLQAVSAADKPSNSSSSAEPTSSTSNSTHSSSSPPLSSPPPSSSASISPSANVSSTAPVSANASSTGLPSPVAPPPTIPGKLPNSFPQNYSDIPFENDFSPDWQDYFQVKQGFPNISFPLSRNFAGNLPNGPMLLHNDFSITQNSMSWSNLLDIFWIDQPVGSGFSTVDSDGYAKNEDDVSADFLGFLTNLVKVFPSLGDRPLILAGEDYAGIFIPYIAQALLSSSSPPVNLQKIVIGNGLMGGFSIVPNLATISILESFPQLIKFNTEVFQSFRTQQQACGLDVNLTYPQEIPLQPIQATPRKSSFWTTVPKEAKAVGVLDRRGTPPSPDRSRSRLVGRQSSLSGSLDPFYQCALFDEMIDFAANNSFPWAPGNFNPWNVPDLVNPQASLDAGPYFNSDQVRGALHAPTSKNWTSVAAYPFGSTTNFCESIIPVTFFNDLVSTANARNIEFILFTGANNAIANHRGLEKSANQWNVQNATFGGTRGFTRKPSTPWADDDGNVAGIVHTERGITYGLFDGVGHLIPHFNPGAAYVFFRDFIVNANETGSITTDSKSNTVVLGGEDPSIADDVPRIATEIFLGASSTQSTFAAPSATVAAWQSFLGTVPNLSGTKDAANAAPATVNSLLASMSAAVLAALTVWVSAVLA
ncbi:alpha/beta-hydrolase [Dentipellis sp. KUC8613]|nr:alpha/beta-hydrolase [Dentipellis sp. KUC8613]